MIKRLTTLISLLLCLNVFASDTEQAIRRVLNAQIDAWNKGDMEQYMQGYWKSDSLVFIGKNGPKYGWKTTLENYRKSYPDKSTMGILSFDILKIESINEANAFVIGRWKLRRENDE